MKKKPERYLRERGFVEPSELPKGPNGRALCRFCKAVEVSPPKRTFCSDLCVHEFKIRSQAGYAREQVLQRDRGVCRTCGLDTEKLRQLLYRVKVEKGDDPYNDLLQHYEKTTGYRFDLQKHFFEVDHIRPVDWGGGSCGLDNLQTLCVSCHKTKTRRQRRMKTRGKR